MRVLFLTWDGPQQSYLESLFFPIFAGLRPRGIDVRVLQLTWGNPEQLAAVHAAATQLELSLTTRRVPSSLRRLALPAAIAYGAGAALQQVAAQQIDALFPRSLIPMTMALGATRLRPELSLLFDADGFMADERLDFGGWRADGVSYRALRAVEAEGVRRARAVICRTEHARGILARRSRLAGSEAKIFVAPNPKDSTLFAPQTAAERQRTRAQYGIAAGAPWVVYVGSIGPQYCPELMLDACSRIHERRPDARFSLFTFHAAELERRLRSRPALAAALSLGQLQPAEVPRVLAAADLGLAPRQPHFSQLGISPIKVGEYLLCGTPVVASRVGDLPQQLAQTGAALLVDPDDAGAPAEVARWFVEQVLPARDTLRAEARALGLRWFDLKTAVDTYERALRYGAAPEAP